MYNFNFENNEKLVEIFDDVLIRELNNEKLTTIALTDKRLLFLDYSNTNDGLEALRIVWRINNTKHKEVYYQINLDDIKSIIEDKYYKVILKENKTFEFNNEELYKLLKIERKIDDGQIRKEN